VVPEYPKFTPLEPALQKTLSQHLNLSPRNICELALANFFIWKDFDHPQLTLINRNLCILITAPSEPPYFLEPLGRNKVTETVETCLQHIGKISRVSRDLASLLPSNRYKIVPQPNQFDYVYLTQELATLKGKKFDGKRNHIRRFKNRFPDYSFVPLGEEFKKESLDLFERWFAIRKESRYFPRLAHTAQKNAILSAFSSYKQLSLEGGAILLGKSLKGFTLGSRLNSEALCVHFLYGDPDLPGISQAMLWEACNKTYGGFKYLNLEQDLGIPGLRSAKLSYHPLRLEEKLEITW
jgi:hypothetical protein